LTASYTRSSGLSRHKKLREQSKVLFGYYKVELTLVPASLFKKKVELTHDDNLKDAQMEEYGDKGREEHHCGDKNAETPDTVIEPAGILSFSLRYISH
jgi:hypothetical protein